MARRGREEWRAAVFRHKGLNGNVGMLLMYLADHMKSDLTVSVPRTRIAEDLNINVRRVTERIKAAHDAGLLDTLTHGRERVTAVYKATFPSGEVRTGGRLGGAVIRTSQDGLGGADGGPTISGTSPREVGEPTGGNGSSVSRAFRANEKSEKQQGGPAAAGRETQGSANAGRETPRKQMLTAIQRAAVEGVNSVAGDELSALLKAQYGHEVEEYAEEYWRDVPRKASDRYEAGVWLNKLVNTARRNGFPTAAMVNKQEPGF